jgi:hypothetical protein
MASSSIPTSSIPAVNGKCPVSSPPAVEADHPVSNATCTACKPPCPFGGGCAPSMFRKSGKPALRDPRGCTGDEFMARYAPRLPPMTLYQSAAKAPTKPCLIHGCKNTPRSTLGRIHCKSHRDNLYPSNGWVHITSEEFTIFSRLREYLHVDLIADMLDVVEEAMQDIDARTSLVGDSESDDESVAVLAEAAGELNIGSGDEL